MASTSIGDTRTPEDERGGEGEWRRKATGDLRTRHPRRRRGASLSCVQVVRQRWAARRATCVPLASRRGPRHPARPPKEHRTMGRQWLHAKKEVTANRRAQMTSKLVREIMVAAKMGVPDPAMNPRLSLAVEAARKQSVGNDVITRAI